MQPQESSSAQATSPPLSCRAKEWDGNIKPWGWWRAAQAETAGCFEHALCLHIGYISPEPVNQECI